MPNGRPGYLLDVQASLIDQIPTRVVVPLKASTQTPIAMRDLHPTLSVNGEQLVMWRHEIGSIHKRELRKPIASLTAEHDAITRALDILFTGF